MNAKADGEKAFTKDQEIPIWKEREYENSCHP